MTPAWLTPETVVSYSLQLALIGGVGLLLPRLFRLRDPEALEYAWHAALGAAVAFPLIGIGRFFPIESIQMPAVNFSIDAAAAAAPATARLSLLPILAAGACVMLAWRALGLVRLRALRRSAAPVELPSVMSGETLRLHRRLLGFGEPRYFRCERIASPLVYGVFRPTVLLPDSFFALPENLRRAVLMHELWHVRRNDWLGLLWLELSRCVLWFHPVVHLIAGRIADAREQIVDRKVIELTADRRSYLDALIAIARSPAPGDRLLAPLFLEKNRLKQRIQVILEEKPMPAKERYAWLAVITVALLFSADWARDSFPVYAQTKSPQIYKAGEDGVEAPRLIRKVDPQYTEEARESRVSGTVKVSCEVHADGRAHNIKVLEGLEGGLNAKAIEAIEAWEFKPGTRNGEPVAVSAMIEVNFRLLDKAPQDP